MNIAQNMVSGKCLNAEDCSGIFKATNTADNKDFQVGGCHNKRPARPQSLRFPGITDTDRTLNVITSHFYNLVLTTGWHRGAQPPPTFVLSILPSLFASSSFSYLGSPHTEALVQHDHPLSSGKEEIYSWHLYIIVIQSHPTHHWGHRGVQPPPTFVLSIFALTICLQFVLLLGFTSYRGSGASWPLLVIWKRENLQLALIYNRHPVPSLLPHNI